MIFLISIQKILILYFYLIYMGKIFVNILENKNKIFYKYNINKILKKLNLFYFFYKI